MSTATREVLLACGRVPRSAESLGYSEPEVGATSIGYSEPAEPASVQDLDDSPQGYAEAREGAPSFKPSAPYVEILETGGEVGVPLSPQGETQRSSEPETPYRLAGKRWLSARATCQAQLGKVEQAILDAYANTEQLPWAKKTSKNLHAVLWALDHELSDAVWAIDKADSARKRQMAQEESEVLIDAFRRYLAEEPLVSLIDSNPFFKTTLGQTLGDAITFVEGVVNAGHA